MYRINNTNQILNTATIDPNNNLLIDFYSSATTETFAVPYNGFGATSFTIDSLNLFEEYDINKTVATKVTSGGPPPSKRKPS